MSGTESRRKLLTGLGSLAGLGAAVGLGLGLGTATRAAVLRGRSGTGFGAAGDGVDGDAGWIEGHDTPLEDLMREHAVLERVLLVYEEGARRLEAAAGGTVGAQLDVAPETLSRAAGIVRRYIEDHHERDEETHVFPRLERIDAEVDLIATLRAQHAAGRRLTSEVLALSTFATWGDPAERARLVRAIRLFVRMYRPHAAQENTVLFPSFRRAVSQAEYEGLRVELEKSEHAAFGDDPYVAILGEVRELEGALGIGELAAFTPP
jgi:hemerythrin-like domain-containing protein